MKKLACILILAITTLHTYGQNEREKRVKAWEEELEQAKADTTRVRIYVNLALTYRAFDFDKSEEYNQLALDLAISTGDAFYISKAVNATGVNYTYANDLDKAIKYSSRAQEILGADTINLRNNSQVVNIQLGQIYNNIAMAYDYQNEYTQSIKYYTAALDVYELEGKTDGIAVIRNNLGITYLYIDDLEKSRENFQAAYDLQLSVGDTLIGQSARMNIGLIEYLQGDTLGAISTFRQCQKQFHQAGNLRSEGNCLTNIADVHKELGNLDSALYYTEKGLAIDIKLGDKNGESINSRILGDIYLLQKNFSTARKYYLRSLEIAEETNITTDKRDSYIGLSNIEKEAGDYEAALEYHAKYKIYDDSLKQESNSKVLGKIEAEYEYNQKLAVQKAEDEQKLKTEEEKRKKQTVLLYFSVGGIIAVIIFAVLIWRSLKITRKQKELLDEVKQEIEEKNQELVDSITYAKRIQSAILPPDKLIAQHLPQSFVLYIPKDIVAGDFYWLEPTAGKIIFAAADCTGHGVPGAMVSVVCHNGLNRAVREFGYTQPGDILNKTRELVVAEFEKSEEQVKDGMDIALCALNGNHLEYAGAHNPLWVIRNGTKEIEEIKANKQPIGQFDHPQPYTSHSIQVNPGDMIYIFSDGFQDQFGGEKGKKYKGANLKKFLVSIAHEKCEKQHDLLLQEFERWKGPIEQLDDVCIIGVRI